MAPGGAPPLQGRGRRRGRLLAALVAAVAAAAYLNTLPAQFTFDDSFAVIYNGDVTDHNKPLRALLSNDFWGQEIRSPMSHKSFRPLTILSFRLQHLASTRLLPQGKPQAERSEWEEGRRSGDRGINPLLFHISNVAAHSGVTALVFVLARRLVSVRSRREADGSGSSSGSSGKNSKNSSSAAEAAAGGDSWCAADVEAFIAALLFALHPVHCEAVAGIVGHAEMLCATLSIPALLSYMAAADGRVRGGGLAHWRAVAAAVLLGWAAALTKEIGITIMGAMLCYDILLVPLAGPDSSSLSAPAGHTVAAQQTQPPPLPVQAQQQQQQQQQLAQAAPASSTRGRAGGKSSSLAAAAVAAAATELLQLAAAANTAAGSNTAQTKLQNSGGSGGSGGGIRGSDSGGVGSAACRRALRRKLLRMAAAAAGVVLYVKARSWLAGDQLVRIYRKVENPIPFSTSSLERKLTTGYLHARYAWLLLAPLQLSADWSYACIEYVSSLSDPRNLATAALYLTLLYLGLSARPWEVLLEWSGCRPAVPPSQQQHERRWRLAVAAGLLVGPFFPASNVLFYVGTFIGERLLYFPSVGYCILLAQPFAAAILPLLQPSPSSNGSKGNAAAKASLRSSTESSTSIPPPSRRRRRMGAAMGAALLAALLLFYAVRTVVRNDDWRDEERLFLSAQKVCWRSGKVQLNSGILERRYQRWDKAEMHFRLAREVDPQGFCEPDYHTGVTLLNNNLTAALHYLDLGVACKYTSADSIKALNRIYMSLLERSPAHAAGVMERWAAVLARPELQRFTEAATYFEQAAAKAGSPLAAVMVLNRGHNTLEAAQPVNLGRTPEFPVRVAATSRQLAMLTHCLAGRRPVILAMLGTAGNLTAPEVKQAAYSYLSEHGDECRGPVPVPEILNPEDKAALTTSYHTALIHALQEADPNDPWLQQEWGLMLVAGGRQQEALVHLEVAGHIFASQLPALKTAPGTAASRAGTPPGLILNADGTGPISQPEAGAAAVQAYRHAQAAVQGITAAPGARIDPVARQRVLCHMRQAECAALQQAAVLPAVSSTAASAAAADAERCWKEAQASGCSGAGAGGGASSSGPPPRDKEEEEEAVEEVRDEL